MIPAAFDERWEKAVAEVAAKAGEKRSCKIEKNRTGREIRDGIICYRFR